MKSIGCFQRRLFICLCVCLFFCQHDNFRMSKHRMMKFGVDALYKNLGHTPSGCAHPKNVVLGYDVGKISAGCLVWLYSCGYQLWKYRHFYFCFCFYFHICTQLHSVKLINTSNVTGCHRGPKRASGWVQSAVTKMHVMLRLFFHRRVWYHVLSALCVFEGIILIP